MMTRHADAREKAKTLQRGSETEKFSSSDECTGKGDGKVASATNVVPPAAIYVSVARGDRARCRFAGVLGTAAGPAGRAI